MSEETNTNQEAEQVEQTALESLKARADLLGVKYHPSISEEKLREKIAEAQKKDEPKAEAKKEESKAKTRAELREEALKLVRVRITNMNPAKADYEGEIYTVGNSVIGTVKRYVPFNADDGWHVEQVLYEHLKDRQVPVYVTKTDKKGNKIREHKMIREFAIEVLPPLTVEELKELAERQAISRSID